MARTRELWNNETIAIPQGGWVGERIFVSPVHGCNNESKAKAIIQIHDLDPDADANPGELGNYLLEFVLEESLDNGATWYAIANQFEQIKGTLKAQTHVVELSDRINFESGSVNRIGNGLTAISQTQGELQDTADYRVACIRTIVSEGSQNPDLQSITLSGTLQTW